MRRVVLAVGPFCLVVSVSYAVLTIPSGQFSGGYLVLVNLRVAVLTSLTFLVMERVNLHAPWVLRGLLYVVTLATSQGPDPAPGGRGIPSGAQGADARPAGAARFVPHSAASAARLLARGCIKSGEIAFHAGRGFFDDTSSRGSISRPSATTSRTARESWKTSPFHRTREKWCCWVPTAPARAPCCAC